MMPLMMIDQAVFQQIQNTYQPPFEFPPPPTGVENCATTHAVPLVGLRHLAAGFAGVALCHDVVIAWPPADSLT
jgi:hypothetical protein